LGRVEASATAPEYSPLAIRQEDRLQPENGFPKNNREFLRYSFEKIIKGVGAIESLQAVNDGELAAIEWFQLRLSPVFQGIGMPRGEGTVVIATGFGTHPSWYSDTAKFFERIGYKPKIYDAEAFLNVIPVEQLIYDFMNFLSKQNGRVKLFGHSKGGLLSFATYVTHHDEFTKKVEHVVFVGSPRPDWVNFAVGSPYFGAQIGFGGDDFKFAGEILDNSDIENIDGTMVTSIGNPRDPIIRGQFIGKPSDIFKIDSSHLGMNRHMHALSISARRFAEFNTAEVKAA